MRLPRLRLAVTGESEAKVIYTIPMPPNKTPTETVGVLPFIQDGRPYRIKGKTFEKTFALVY